MSTYASPDQFMMNDSYGLNFQKNNANIDLNIKVGITDFGG